MTRTSIAVAQLARTKVLAVYGAALLQGLTLVSFPALSNTFKTVLGVSDAQYGTIFLPQVAFAVLGALLGSVLARRVGLRVVLVWALLANAAAQAALAASGALGYSVLLLGTACLGAGFGLIAAPLNSYPSLLFPARRDSALVALHTSLGAGLALGPLLANGLAAHLGWQAFPLSLLFACAAMALWSYLLQLPDADAGLKPAPGASAHNPSRDMVFWLFALIAVLYAFAEGTFANWAVLYLAESKGLSPIIATSALAVFWGALAGGRLLISALLVRIDAHWFWRGLPWAMAAVFLALPWATSATRGIGLFAAAGLACSAFFPLTIGMAGRRYPNDLAWVSSVLTAALMVGVGLGSWLVGWLRQMLAFEQLYQLSVAYPVGIVLLSLLLRKLKTDT